MLRRQEIQSDFVPPTEVPSQQTPEEQFTQVQANEAEQSDLPEYQETRRPVSSPGARASAFSSTVSNLFSRISAWFTSGNVPVKVGVLISFIGVSLFSQVRH